MLKKRQEGIYVKKRLQIWLTGNGNDFGKLLCLLFPSVFAPKNRVKAAPSSCFEEDGMEKIAFVICVKKKKANRWPLPTLVTEIR